MKGLIIAIVRFYQGALSPWLGGRCRFVPSCSEFAVLAVEAEGARGLAAAVRRFLKCHPFGGAGFDPYIKRSERV